MYVSYKKSVQIPINFKKNKPTVLLSQSKAHPNKVPFQLEPKIHLTWVILWDALSAFSHSDAEAAKFCRRLRTQFRCRSFLLQATTVPPWFVGLVCPFFPLPPISVPIIFETENFRGFWRALACCSPRQSLTRLSNA